MVNKMEKFPMEDLENIQNTEVNDIPCWLTKDLFSEFLQKDLPNFVNVTKFIVRPAVATGENYMTVILRVAIEVTMPDSSINSISYMIKIAPATEQLQKMIKDSQVFLKEQTVYRKYLPKFEEFYAKQGVKLRLAPHILQPQHSNVINDDFVILEDLRLKGFRNANRHVGLDMVHTKAVLRKLAQFHAASAHYAHSVEEFPALYSQSLVCEEDLYVDHRLKIGQTLRDHLHLYGDVQDLNEKLKYYVEHQFDPFQKKSERDTNEFYVLNHGDLWLNNIMFQYAADGSLSETYFIDFQMCRYGSPSQDLIYLLFSSTILENKVDKFDYFVAFYHKELIKNLKKLEYKGVQPQLKDIHIALFKHDYWAYTTVALLLPVVLCEPRDDANVDKLLSEDGDALRRAMYSNANYAKNMQILLPWLNWRGALDV